MPPNGSALQLRLKKRGACADRFGRLLQALVRRRLLMLFEITTSPS